METVLAPLATPEASDLVRHQQLLQLVGVSSVIPASDDASMFPEARLRFSSETDTFEAATLKIPITRGEKTPYSLVQDSLHVHGVPFEDVSGVRATTVAIPPAADEWHLKGYTLPYRGTNNPLYELRVNPRITGYCPGRCQFCHRTHSHQVKPARRMVTTPAAILERFGRDEGDAALARVTRVMFIAELFGQESTFLDAVEQTRAALTAGGYPEQNEFNCCAQDVRTPAGHRRLMSIVRPARFSYTLEFFGSRAEIMGHYKGLSIDMVFSILASAREAGFAEIQLNYLAGIDSLEVAVRGFEELRRRGLVDSVGLSTFTAWSTAQEALRHPDAWETGYYEALVQELRRMKILAYRPLSYDMRCPYHVMLEETTL